MYLASHHWPVGFFRNHDQRLRLLSLPEAISFDTQAGYSNKCANEANKLEYLCRGKTLTAEEQLEVERGRYKGSFIQAPVCSFADVRAVLERMTRVPRVTPVPTETGQL